MTRLYKNQDIVNQGYMRDTRCTVGEHDVYESDLVWVDYGVCPATKRLEEHTCCLECSDTLPSHLRPTDDEYTTSNRALADSDAGVGWVA